MVAPIYLQQYPFLGHAFAPDTVSGRPAAAGAVHAGADQDAAYRRAAQVDPLPFHQQLGQGGQPPGEVAYSSWRSLFLLVHSSWRLTQALGRLQELNRPSMGPPPFGDGKHQEMVEYTYDPETLQWGHRLSVMESPTRQR